MTHSAPAPSDPVWTVGEVARLAGISVRTLHHWDAVGLVQPTLRTTAGYRCYDAANLARVHRVLVYRDLGMSLAQIAAALDRPGTVLDQLERQRELLREQTRHLEHRTRQVERMITMEKSGIRLTPDEAQEIFGTEWKPEYQDEAYERWGDSPQWKQSTARTAAFSKADWQRVKDQTDALNAELGAACRDGVDPASTAGGELAEKHRAAVEQFYDCTHSMQVCLARMYVADERFAATYEAVEPGLTAWLLAAVEANARRHGVDPDTAEWE